MVMLLEGPTVLITISQGSHLMRLKSVSPANKFPYAWLFQQGIGPMLARLAFTTGIP